MDINEVIKNKKQYLPLLLLADEQESMIDLYLDRGRMFVLKDNGTAQAVCVVTDEGNNILEIKNLAVETNAQRKGYGRLLIEYIVDNFKVDYKVLEVGTGDSLLTVPFYEKCGFKKSRVLPRFFLDNYNDPIYEEGKQLIDMIYLKRKL